VVIAGRPNVGKSTLLNGLIGAHLAATAAKPQTTRNRILGVRTEGSHQFVFVDTPGIHLGGKRLLNRMLNKTAIASLQEADVVLFVVEAGQWTREDAEVLMHLQKIITPVVLVVNKIDLLKRREDLLPFLQKMQSQHDYAEIIPLSAFDAKTLQYLISQLQSYLPSRPFEFSEDDLTDRSMRFISAEMVREQLMSALEQELPYALAVEIEQYQETESGIDISAVIYVEREGQKKIVIGKGGGMLKKIGTEARRRIAGLAGKPVHLKLWVKIKSGWQDNAGLLRQFGLDE
jgi:GTP-binding protein Era